MKLVYFLLTCAAAAMVAMFTCDADSSSVLRAAKNDSKKSLILSHLANETYDENLDQSPPPLVGTIGNPWWSSLAASPRRSLKGKDKENDSRPATKKAVADKGVEKPGKMPKGSVTKGKDYTSSERDGNDPDSGNSDNGAGKPGKMLKGNGTNGNDHRDPKGDNVRSTKRAHTNSDDNRFGSNGTGPKGGVKGKHPDLRLRKSQREASWNRPRSERGPSRHDGSTDRSHSDAPSDVPSDIPSSMPSDIPSSMPSDVPSSMPTSMPTDGPTGMPSLMPTV